MSGGKGSKRGTPQGGVRKPFTRQYLHEPVSEILASVRLGEAFRAHVVSYADDFVILSRGHAVEALAWTKAVMIKLGLTIIEAKTSLKDARKDRFDFLGYSFGPICYKETRKWYLSASPSKKSVQRLKVKTGNLLVPANTEPWPEVLGKLNSMLQGRSNYFCHGTRRAAYRAIDSYVYERVRNFLRGRLRYGPTAP